MGNTYITFLRVAKQIKNYDWTEKVTVMSSQLLGDLYLYAIMQTFFFFNVPNSTLCELRLSF